jgi:hypothetical protein
MTRPEAPAAPAEGRTAPPLAIPLRAGPLRVVFDRGWLRWIRLGERGVLHGIYPAVRETGWATVPARLEDLVVEAEPESFRIRFVARHERGEVRLDWEARIEGASDGKIDYAIDGVAGATFLVNRVGFCVLHPVADCAGEACSLETTGGEKQAGRFPRLVSPHQPFLDLRAIAHEPVPGVTAEVRMEGGTFETEDQRNWSDASFKTYCPPLALPFPSELKKGTRIRQSVTLRLLGPTRQFVREAAATVPGALPKKKNSTEPVIVRLEPGGAFPRPALGIAGAGMVSLSDAEAGLVRALRLAHLRADLHLEADGWEASLERAVSNATRVGVPLELALFLPDEPQPRLRALAARAAGLPARVSHWLVFRAADSTTAEGDAAAARGALGAVARGARFSGGTDRYFAELNRRRPSPAGLDRLGFSLNPQVHAFDDATLFENVASLPWLAETARAFAAGLPLALTPVTLRPRSDPRPPASRAEGEPPFTDDPRQAAPVAAAWTLALIGSAAQAGFSSLTFFELTGPRGLILDGRPYPVYHALAELAALGEAAFALARSRRPERVQAVALRAGRRTRLVLANVSDDPHPVRIEGLTGTARRAALGECDAGEPCEPELGLEPHEIACLEVQEA